MSANSVLDVTDTSRGQSSNPSPEGSPIELQSKGSEIIRRYDRLLSQRANFETLFQEVADYVLPRKSNITVKRSPGTKQTEKLYDSTAINANELLASSLQSTLMSTSILWFSIVPRNRELMKDLETRDWCENTTNKIFYAIRNSNFDSEAPELCLDLGAFGTSCMRQEEKQLQRKGFNGFVFETLDISEYVIEENAMGFVDTVIRKFRYTARQAWQRWGKNRLPSAIAQSRPDKEFDFIHAVYPRNDYDGRKLTKENMRIASCYVSLNSRTLIDEQGYNYFPYVVPRWRKTSGEVWGRSCAMTALPDIRTLNKAKELGLKAWAKDINPSLMVMHDSVLGNISTAPNAIIAVLMEGAITPLKSGSSYDVTQWKENELKDAIRKSFFADQLAMPPFQGTPMTATEVQARLEQTQRVMGPTVGRIKIEFLNPLVINSYQIMFAAGEFQDMPQTLIDYQAETGDNPLDIEFSGPMARAQKMVDVAAFEQFFGRIAIPMGQVRPEVFDKIDADSVVDFGADRLGIPPRLMNSDAKVKQIREARAQMQQQAMQAQQQQQQTEQMARAVPLAKAMSEQEEEVA